MIRNQICKIYFKLNLSKSYNSIILSKRSLQKSSSVLQYSNQENYKESDCSNDEYDNKYGKRNYGKRERDYAKRNREFNNQNQEFDKKNKSYVHRNDDLLDVERFINISDKLNNNEKKPLNTKKITLKKKVFKSCDSDIEDRFCQDVKLHKNPNQLVLEGKYLINDVIKYGFPKIIRIYYSEEEKLNKINDLTKLKENGVEFLQVSYSSMKQYLDVKTPQGLVGIVERDVSKLFEINSKKNQNEVPLILVVNNLRDPGNMGTLIRSSLACGVTKFLCLKKCARLLKNKVIRSTAGSIFRIPFIENLTVTDLEKHIPDNARIYLADSNLNPMDLRVNPELNQNDYDELEDYSQTEDEIEKNQEDNKLINYKLDKNELKIDHNEEDDLDKEEQEKIQEDNQTNNKSQIDNNVIENLNDNRLDTLDNLKTVSYLNANYFSKPDDCVVLIVNGETGISNEMIEFIKSRDCTRINIPLANDVDSLNSSVAGSLLIFEIKRQYLHHFKN